MTTEAEWLRRATAATFDAMPLGTREALKSADALADAVKDSTMNGHPLTDILPNLKARLAAYREARK